MKFTAYASSSSGNLYGLSDGQTDIIIECGVSYRDMQKLLPKSPTSYDACFVSHRHGDHCNAKTWESLENRGVIVLSGAQLEAITVGRAREFMTVKTIDVQAFPVKHDVPNHGFMFRSAIDGKTAVFLIDTFYSPIVPSFSPTIVAIECNYARDLMRPGDSINDRLFASHMGLDQCIKTLKAWDLSKTREIHLLHLSDDRSDEARFIREVQEATGVPVFVAPCIGASGRGFSRAGEPRRQDPVVAVDVCPTLRAGGNRAEAT
jgi:phosphoribosyl 1,2-cyclic phosphodiesterase